MAGHPSPQTTSSVGECRRDHEHEHGLTIYCYNNGCRCESCRGNARLYYKRRRARQGHSPLVPAIGTERRLQALAWMGWSTKEIADRIGENPYYLIQVRNGYRGEVRLVLHRKVAKFYDKHQMVHFTGPRAKHVSAVAKLRGWAPPLAWDNIDDEREVA